MLLKFPLIYINSWSFTKYNIGLKIIPGMPIDSECIRNIWVLSAAYK